jgi:hypothetical protein
MIQLLRRTHRVIFFALGIALPVLFIGGLLARHAPLSAVQPVEDKLAQTNGGTEFVLNHGSSKFTVRLVENRKGEAQREFLVIPNSGFLAPDVLLYRSETQPGASRASWDLANFIEFHPAPAATSFYTASRKTKCSVPFA